MIIRGDFVHELAQAFLDPCDYFKVLIDHVSLLLFNYDSSIAPKIRSVNQNDL